MQAVDCQNDRLILLIRLDRPATLPFLLGCASLPFIEYLFDLIIPVKALFPLQILLVDEHLSIFDSVSESESVDNREFTDARRHQAEGDVVCMRAVVECEVIYHFGSLLEQLDA